MIYLQTKIYIILKLYPCSLSPLSFFLGPPYTARPALKEFGLKNDNKCNAIRWTTVTQEVKSNLLTWPGMYQIHNLLRDSRSTDRITFFVPQTLFYNIKKWFRFCQVWPIVYPCGDLPACWLTSRTRTFVLPDWFTTIVYLPQNMKYSAWKNGHLIILCIREDLPVLPTRLSTT